MTENPVSPNLQEYKHKSGHLDPVYVEIQTLPDNVDDILDASWRFIPWPMGGTNGMQVSPRRGMRPASLSRTQPLPHTTNTIGLVIRKISCR